MLRSNRHGWSLVELTIILIVLSIICAILVPVISVFVLKAKIVRCREDVQALGCVIWMYICDTANPMFFIDGNGNGGPSPARAPAGGAPSHLAGNRVNMLVGDGDIPHILPAVTLLPGPGGINWDSPVNNSTVDFFERHLVTNNPGGVAANHYRTPLDLTNALDPMFARTSSAGFNSEFAWRGPYITGPIDPDPWGNRYMSNVVFLDPIILSDGSAPSVHTNGLGGYVSDVIVLSAGQDEETDTFFGTGTGLPAVNQVDGQVPGDDDVLAVISANSRP